MAKLQNRDSLLVIMPPIPAIVDIDWLETVPGHARKMNSGVALPQPVNLVSQLSFSITIRIHDPIEPQIELYIKCNYKKILEQERKTFKKINKK